MAATQPKMAIVLSGGAGLGAAQAGMMRALFERGIAPDLVTGLLGFFGARGHLISQRPLRDLVSGQIGFDALEEALIRRGDQESRDHLDAVEAEDAPVPLRMSMHRAGGRRRRLSEPE